MSKTAQKFHVTMKPNVELKRQRPCEDPLHVNEKLEKLATLLKDPEIIREMGVDDDEMGQYLLTSSFYA